MTPADARAPADPRSHPEVQRVGEEVGQYLAEIATLFKPGTKLTFLARQPDFPDGTRDMVLTNDDLAAVLYAIRLRKENPNG